MPAAIEVENLKKTFGGDVVALGGVSFSVEPGTVFGLLGPNGAGKTTIVRVLTTILRPSSGTALVLGHDAVKDPTTVRSLIGLAGQYAAVDENLTGRENLRMVSRLNHLDRATSASRAVELLDQFGLTDAGDRPTKTYSGGMRRRLDLAAALVARPPVLFLDEPTTGLDPQSRIDLWGVIETLVGEGTTVLLTTQYLEEADRLASQLAVINHGQLIAEGTPEKMKSDMGSTVLDLGMATPEMAARAVHVLAGVGNKHPVVDDCHVEVGVDNGPRVMAEVLSILDAEQLMPLTLSLREPSLDDVFLELTGKKTGDEVDSESPSGR